VEVQLQRLDQRLAQQSLQVEVDKSARKLLAREGTIRSSARVR